MCAGLCLTLRFKRILPPLCSSVKTEKWLKNLNQCSLTSLTIESKSNYAIFSLVWLLLPTSQKFLMWLWKETFWRDVKSTCRLTTKIWSMWPFISSVKSSNWETTSPIKMETTLWTESKKANWRIGSCRKLTTPKIPKSVSLVRSWKRNLMTIDRLEDKSIQKMTLFYRISLQASKKWLFLSIIYSSNELICIDLLDGELCWFFC